MKKNKNTYQEKILKQTLKNEVIEKILQIKQYVEEEAPCVYGASYEENLALIREDLEDILLNWKN